MVIVAREQEVVGLGKALMLLLSALLFKQHLYFHKREIEEERKCMLGRDRSWKGNKK